MRYYIKSKVQQPGKRGGKYWIDKKGEIQYDEKPGERQPRQINQAKSSRRAIDVSEFKKHGIPQDARHAYQYESHEKYTHEWRDSKGRLQRRYKPEFVAAKQAEKYKRISNAINRLPELREAVNNDINGKNVIKKHTALAIRIMDLTGARVGNEKYTDENETHGITTLEKDHCIFQDDKAILDYIGKKGVHQTHEIDQPEVVAALRELKQMPGKRLFQIDDKGNVSSDGVNKYLKIYGLTAKDLRTFRANVEFTKALKDVGRQRKDEKNRKKIVAEALKVVSERLGNTPNVCRTNYISPEILDGYLNGKLSLKFAMAKGYDVKDYDELFDDDEMGFVELWSEATAGMDGKYKDLEKSHVAGHFRKMDTGRTVFVNPYENSVIKKEEPQFQKSDVLRIPLDMIERDETQPRENFNQSDLQKLGDSIRKIGLMQPIGVRRTEGDGYKIIFGERRWRASKMVGLTDIPARIFDIADKKELYAIQVAENLARADMNPIETANAYKKLSNVGMGYEEIGERIGVSPLTVQRKISLTTLIPEIQNLVKNGDLTETNGILIAMAGLRNQFQMEVLKKINKAGKKLNREELNGMVSRYQTAQNQTSLFGSDPAIITQTDQINKNKVEAVKRQIASLVGKVVTAAEKIINDKNYKLAPAILKEQGKLARTKEELKLLQSYLTTIVKEMETAESFFKTGGTVQQYLSKQNVKRGKRIRKAIFLIKSVVRAHTKTSKTGKLVNVGQYTNMKTKHPVPRKIAQTQTPEFKKWFGDSKVVDENGKPLVVYHGTKIKFTSFDLNKTGSNNDPGMWGKGFYFSPIRNFSRGYGNNIMRVYLSIKNPLIVKGTSRLPDELKPSNNSKDSLRLRNKLISMGYDGVIQYEASMGKNGLDYTKLTQIVAFSPTQIKSATGNVGTFGINNPDITKSIRYLIKGKVFPVGHISIYRDGTVWKKVADTGQSDDWRQLEGAEKTRALKRTIGAMSVKGRSIKTVRTLKKEGKKVVQTEKVTGRNKTTVEEKKTHRDIGVKVGGAKKDIWAQKLRNGGALSLADVEKIEEDNELAERLITKENIWPKPDPEAGKNLGMTSGCAYLITTLHSMIRSKPEPLLRKYYPIAINNIVAMVRNCKTYEDFQTFLDTLHDHKKTDRWYGYERHYDIVNNKPRVVNIDYVNPYREQYESLGKEFFHNFLQDQRIADKSVRGRFKYISNINMKLSEAITNSIKYTEDNDWSWAEGAKEEKREKVDLSGPVVDKYLKIIKNNKRLHDLAYWTAINSPNAEGWYYSKSVRTSYVKAKIATYLKDYTNTVDEILKKYPKPKEVEVGLQYGTPEANEYYRASKANRMISELGRSSLVLNFPAYDEKMKNLKIKISDYNKIKIRFEKCSEKYKKYKNEMDNNPPQSILNKEKWKHEKWGFDETSIFSKEFDDPNFDLTSELRKAGITDPIVWTKAAYKWRQDSIPSKETPGIMKRKGPAVGGGDEKSIYKRFGLRAVEYGNYVDDESREYHSNQCTMAFADMARILKLSEKDIAFNGRLAIGFGTRGAGAALATYYPDRKIINITKNRGGGSLAHEWGHFFDNIMGEKTGVKYGFLSEGITFNNITENVASAYRQLIINIKHKKGPDHEVYHGRSNIASWPSIDDCISISNNDASMAYEKAMSYYPKMTYYDKSARARIAEYIAKKCGEPCVVKLSVKQQYEQQSDFSKRSERCGKYWAKATEMFARAFACYIEDKLNSRSEYNTYLTHSTKKDKYTSDYFYPYPDGNERKAINKAFDELFKAVRDNKEMKKSIFRGE